MSGLISRRLNVETFTSIAFVILLSFHNLVAVADEHLRTLNLLVYTH